jgi:hypothetical protein
MASLLRVALAGLLLVAAGAAPAPREEAFISVGGRRVGVALAPERAEFLLGEPATVLFALHNYSDQELQVIEGGDYRNNLGRPESFKVTVRDSDGTAVPQPDAGDNAGGISAPRKIPAGGSYSFRLFLPHWATISQPGIYTMTAGRKLEFLKDKARGLARADFITVEANVATSLKVLPASPEDLGRIIDRLGTALLVPGEDTWPDTPAKRLASIHDERTIPWWTRAFATRSYELKFNALAALAEFDRAEVFEVLQRGMDVRPADLDGAGPGQVGEQYAMNIRHAAAVALARSPHPAAQAFLISCRNDESSGVRTTILHVLGKMPPDAAIPILEEMASDKDSGVSQEAKRYLALLRAKR